MKFVSTKQFAVIMLCMFASVMAFSQQRSPVDIASAHVQAHLGEWGLTPQDIEGMTVNDQYTDPTTGIARVFFLQRYQGIPVYNAIQNLSMTKEGKVFHVGNRFLPNVAAKANTTTPVLNAEAAVVKLMEHLQLPLMPVQFIRQNEKGDFLFEKGSISQYEISARLSYQPFGSTLRLAWDVLLAPVKSSDVWSVRLDAVTGEILNKTNLTVYCKVDKNVFTHTDEHSEAIANQQHAAVTTSLNLAANGTYNIWPWPYESPSHGPRTMVVDPFDPTASPYGWHDTNGQTGPEYTITRGNNAHAYEDSGNTNNTVNNEPNGGANLIFDFPFDPLTEPSQYRDAAVVNLFYWNNVMHDMAYSYGFTESAGNFQVNNYGQGGAGNDYVRAEAQDGNGVDNANFATLADGTSGRMQMYLWNPGKILTVSAPASIAGGYTSYQPAADWGPGTYASATGVSAEVVIAQDEIADPFLTDACDTLINAAQLQGKIALIDRGGCDFGWKALQAQKKGAVGVIICNYDESIIGMSPGTYGVQVNIPTVFITAVKCQALRPFAGNGLVASIKIPAPTVPSQLDGDLDNGIVAHEYGHGISNRLTGGPSNANCLANAEQMGEGWSDFIGLVMTTKPGDAGTAARGIGTYALDQPVSGIGIRRYPYSTDMSVNPQTYGDVAGNTEVHALGEVWTTMLWDLYWAFVDEYGWDADLYHGTGGNNLAIRLVFEGMKNQPCSPGFLDGRDAIIAADVALNNGANKCLIWKAFARRGAGMSAVQGLSSNASDQAEAFDIPCECRDEVTVSKSMTDLINAGEDIEVTVNISNCKSATRTGVVISDELPDGTEYKAGSASVPATVTGNVLTLQVGEIDSLTNKTVTYKLTTDPAKFSIRQYLDEVADEDSEENWEYVVTNAPTPNAFLIDDTYSHSPEFSWLVADLATESRTGIELKNAWKVEGNRPTLRFYHLYDTEAGADGGVVDIKKVGENAYRQVADKMLRGGYTGQIQYTTFITPNLYAWSGSTNNEFIASYVDLSEWSGDDIVVRFRFGTDDNTAGPIGWALDDFEFMDLFNYNSEVCVTTAEGDSHCAIAPAEGTIVESQIVSNTVETLHDMTMRVYPNPVDNLLYVGLTSVDQREVNVSLLTVDGKQMMEEKTTVLGKGHLQINVSQLPAGIYFVRIAAKDGVMISKVVVE